MRLYPSRHTPMPKLMPDALKAEFFALPKILLLFKKYK